MVHWIKVNCLTKKSFPFSFSVYSMKQGIDILFFSELHNYLDILRIAYWGEVVLTFKNESLLIRRPHVCFLNIVVVSNTNFLPNKYNSHFYLLSFIKLLTKLQFQASMKYIYKLSFVIINKITTLPMFVINLFLIERIFIY